MTPRCGLCGCEASTREKHSTMTHSTLHRALATMSLGLLGLTGLGCSHPCDTLQERLCADLGSEDCAVFRAAPEDFGGMVPEQYGWSRRHNGFDQCQMFGDDANYAAYTLPQTRYLVALQRDPNTPRPMLQPPSADVGFLTGNWLYALMPVFVFGIIGYSWFARRKALQILNGPPEDGSGPTDGAPPAS